MTTIKYAFKYDEGYVVEIKRNGAHTWYLLRDAEPEPLKFKKMTPITREFEDGTFLSFDEPSLKISE